MKLDFQNSFDLNQTHSDCDEARQLSKLIESGGCLIKDVGLSFAPIDFVACVAGISDLVLLLIGSLNRSGVLIDFDFLTAYENLLRASFNVPLAFIFSRSWISVVLITSGAC